MKTLQKIKDETAKEHGWQNYNVILDNFRFGSISQFSFDDYLDDVAKSYAQQIAEKVRQDCADNAYTKIETNRYGSKLVVAKESILNTPITLE